MKNLFVGSYRRMQQAKFLAFPKRYISDSGLESKVVVNYNKQRAYGPRPILCYAPFTSMFFSREGKMAPCYASYGSKSDSWPQKSIHYSWFEGEFKNIRKEINNGNLNYSCSFCKPIFESENFGSLLPNKYEPYGIGKINYPKIMEFELSSRCNLECIMCDGNLSSAIRKNRDGMPAHHEIYNDKFVDELEEFIPHLQMAEFTGGDPFLIPIYYKIWEKITEINPNCQILITTNANTMNARIEKMLATYKNLHFNMSIDSLNKNNYEEIRKNAILENVIENAKIFIDYCRINKTSCNILVCPLTINSRDLPEIIDFANENNICVYFHTVVKPKKLSLKYQSYEYLKDLIDFLNLYQPRLNTKNQKTNASNYRSLVHLLNTWVSEKSEGNNKLLQINNEDNLLSSLRDQLSYDSYKRLLRLLDLYKAKNEYEQILGKLHGIKISDMEEVLKKYNDSEIEVLIEKL